MNRKSQSEIITTILLILIVLAAVVIVWMVISKFIGGGGSDAECAKVKLRVVGATAATAAVPGGAAAAPGTVTINRMAGSPDVFVATMYVLVNRAAVDNNLVVPNAAGGTLKIGELETKTYNVGNAVGGATPVIVANDIIEVAAVITNSAGQNSTCQIFGQTRA